MHTGTLTRYFAVFEAGKGAVEVHFPDIPGCNTCGKDFDDAYEMAKDALAGCLVHAGRKKRLVPSSYEKLKKAHPGSELIPVPVDPALVERYEDLKRVNIVVKSSVLERMDAFRSKRGMKRSALIEQAVLRYMGEG